jgi:hypothetical protein
MIVELSLASSLAWAGIFEGDRREDAASAKIPRHIRHTSDSVLAIIDRDQLRIDTRSGFYYLASRRTLKDRFSFISNPSRREICRDERFLDQPVVSRCSAFVLQDGNVVSARHCIWDQSDCGKIAFIRNWKIDPVYPDRILIVDKNDISFCKDILTGSNGYKREEDWVIVRPDRKIPSQGLALSNSRESQMSVYLAGHPDGLPQKIIGPASLSRTVQDGKPNISGPIDVIVGNSGGPILNARTAEVEGIVTSASSTDWTFDTNSNCWRMLRCQKNQCPDNVETDISFVKRAILKNARYGTPP